MTEHIAHIARWQPASASVAGWQVQVQSVRNFANSRAPNVRTHFINQFVLGGSSPLTLNVNRPARGTIQINRIAVSPELPGVNAGNPFPWTGTYFNNVPISLTALPKSGYRFVGWSGVGSPTVTASITLNSSAAVTAIFIPELTGTPDADYTLQSSTDLISWTDVAIFTPDIDTGKAVVVHPTQNVFTPQFRSRDRAGEVT